MQELDLPQTEAENGALLSVLDRTFGFDHLRPGQAEAIDALMTGRNVLAVMPTGAGKSLCYQLPALVLGGLTIVVSPLVALMRDQVAALRLNGIAAATINSDFSRADNVATWRAVQAGDVRLLYLSPERLMTEPMLQALGRLDVRLIAIDEAHCISQWGPAFRPEYEALAALRERFSGVPIVALTATADSTTRDDVLQKLFRGDAVSVVTGFDRPNLALAVALKDNWKRQVAEFVAARRDASGIVYCLSRKKTEEVAAFLREAGHDALAFHAGMEAGEKERVQNRFMTEPGVVIVATVAFGMGIDKPDIRYVLHTDLPASPEAYYQEIGRAGRDGAPAETLMLYGLDDIRMRRVFIEQEDSTPERKRREHKRLDSLIAYCEAPECRRRMLLRYFGEEIAPCGNCDVCMDPVATEEGTKRPARSCPRCTAPVNGSVPPMLWPCCAGPRPKRPPASDTQRCPHSASAPTGRRGNGRASSVKWSRPVCWRSILQAMAAYARRRPGTRCCGARGASGSGRAGWARRPPPNAGPRGPRPWTSLPRGCCRN